MRIHFVKSLTVEVQSDTILQRRHLLFKAKDINDVFAKNKIDFISLWINGGPNYSIESPLYHASSDMRYYVINPSVSQYPTLQNFILILFIDEDRNVRIYGDFNTKNVVGISLRFYKLL